MYVCVCVSFKHGKCIWLTHTNKVLIKMIDMSVISLRQKIQTETRVKETDHVLQWS